MGTIKRSKKAKAARKPSGGKPVARHSGQPALRRIAARSSKHAMPVKVVVVTMFDPDAADWPSEFRAWRERYPLDERLDFPIGPRPLALNRAKGVIGVVTGVGNARAAATVTALGTDPRFDLSHAYWIVAGIAGSDPDRMPIGSAAWIDWVVDGDLSQEIDSREMPPDWPTGRLPLGKSKPYMQPPSTLTIQSAFRLNRGLMEWAYSLTKDVALDDPPDMAAYRERFVGHAVAAQPPRVMTGALVASSRLWHGKLLTQWARDWTDYWTQGQGRFVASAMEDAGIAQAFHGLADAGKVDRERLLILRTGSNYTVQEKGAGAADSLAKEMQNGFSAAGPSVEAAYRVARPVVDALVAGWSVYAGQLPTGDDE
jgi:purine nucleoside permease